MSKNEFLKQIEVKNPCSQDWDEMTGNDAIRFCGHCNLNVNNLSAMTRKKALKIVREAEGRICVRYIQNPVDKTPVFGDRLYKITRRAGIAAGVLGASLSLSALTYAQGGAIIERRTGSETETSQSEKTDDVKIENTTANISGTVADPHGAVIPGIVVKLSAKDSSFSSTTVSNESGFYEFKNIPSGNFSLHAEGISGFKTFSKNITVSENADSTQNIQMEVDGETILVMGAVAFTGFSNPLHTAVYAEDLELVTELIARGEDVNATDESHSNITPLFLAVDDGTTKIAETLLNFGAKVNARDDEKQTPLMRLDEDATPELVRLLIKHGAKINLTDKQGNTALILAAEDVKPEVLQELINNGADVNAQNNEGETALMRAAYDDDLEKVKILLLAGADVNLKNKEGETAWDQTSHDEIEKLLESYGAVKSEN